jgi:hypothetical protein
LSNALGKVRFQDSKSQQKNNNTRSKKEKIEKEVEKIEREEEREKEEEEELDDGEDEIEKATKKALPRYLSLSSFHFFSTLHLRMPFHVS